MIVGTIIAIVLSGEHAEIDWEVEDDCVPVDIDVGEDVNDDAQFYIVNSVSMTTTITTLQTD